MTTSTRTSAPAGVLGRGSADVRRYSGVVRPLAEPVPGIGLPAAAFAGDTRTTGDDVARLRALHGTVGAVAGTDAPAAPKFTAQQSTQNDGTTLGIHTPGRPQS